MVADDALGVSRLDGCFADRAIPGNEHRNVGLSQNIVTETEPLRKPVAKLVAVRRNERDLFQGVVYPGAWP